MPDKQCLSCADVNDFCAEECGVVAEHRPRRCTARGWEVWEGRGRTQTCCCWLQGCCWQGTVTRLTLQALFSWVPDGF